MTALGNAKTYTLVASTNQTIDIAAEFAVVSFAGQKEVIHVSFWLKNLSNTAADVIWFRLDGTAATVAGNDCYPLGAGERVNVRKNDFMSFISASTPGFCILGDQSGIVYS
jgi:hypothetical protein